MTLKPDPIEIASDIFNNIIQSKGVDAITDINHLVADLPEVNQFCGLVRLLSEHMAYCYEQNAHVESAQYHTYDESAIHEAANNILETITPVEGLGLPVFRSGESEYLLQNKIADGGFGAVWKVLSKNHKCEVAIKIPWGLCCAIQTWEDRVDILSSEADIMSRLDHPGIVSHIETIEDFGNVNYLAIELLCNEDLVIKKLEQLDLRAVLKWCIQIAEALDYLRHKMIVHRDLTLKNVGLDADNNAKIFDFGMAVPLQNRHDVEGQRAGTPGYMTPEQIFGTSRELGPRSDAAAVGFILFELLAGKSPFHDRSVEAVTVSWMSGILQDQIHSENIPEMVRPILYRCFAYHSDQRYGNAGQMAHDMQNILDNLGKD